MKRLSFVDALRGLAVAGMLVIHQSEWWLTPAARRKARLQRCTPCPKLAAPIFLTLVEVALMLPASSVVICFVLCVLPGPVRMVRRVLD